MKSKKILIVDDEKAINNLVRSYLIKEGFLPFSAYDGKSALTLVREEHPDFIILDIMLPDIEGIDLCLEIRKISNSPILFLSCKSEEIDKIIALSVGGDDYMTKPFLPGELIARIKAHLRRQQIMQEKTVTVDKEIHTVPSLSVNMRTHEVTVQDQLVNLTPKEFEILLLLITNPKRIFSAEQIFEHIWKTKYLQGDSRTVMVNMSTLRKKIEVSPDCPRYILNIRGVGYKFNPPPDNL